MAVVDYGIREEHLQSFDCRFMVSCPEMRFICRILKRWIISEKIFHRLL